jgi:group I intron endonuclease
MTIEKGGIYFILSMVDNKRYIGRSVHIYRRLNEHRRNLNKNTHDNKHLQNAWNKYGASNFVFVPFLFCNVRDSIIEEQRQLDFYNSQEGRLLFNISKSSMTGPSELMHRKAISEGGRKRAPISEETRTKLRIARARKVFSEEEKAKISSARKGQKHTDEAKKKMSNALISRELSDEHKKAISQGLKGHEVSEQTRKKIAEKAMGRKASEQTRKKLSDSHKGIPISESAKKHWFKKGISSEKKEKEYTDKAEDAIEGS